MISDECVPSSEGQVWDINGLRKLGVGRRADLLQHPIKSARTQLLISEQNPERSVARDDDSSNAVGNIKIITFNQRHVTNNIRINSYISDISSCVR